MSDCQTVAHLSLDNYIATTAAHRSLRRRGRTAMPPTDMNMALWVGQALLAVVFLTAGMMKLTQPAEELVDRLPFMEAFTPRMLRVAGMLEVLGAAGIVMPSLLRVLPWVTVLSAGGLMLTMIVAMITHLRRSEYPHVVANVLLFVLAGFVAWGRW